MKKTPDPFFNGAVTKLCRRWLGRLLFFVVSCAATLSTAQQHQQHQQQRALIFAVSEGTSGGVSMLDVMAKYEGLRQVISRAVNRPVYIVLAREFERLEQGMKQHEFDLVMARPSDYPARGVRDYNYRLVTVAKPDGHCLFIVPRNSPLQKLAETKGKRFVMPERIAYMTRFCRAELRDAGVIIENENVQYVREQSTVAFSLTTGLVDVGGIASYSGAARTLEKNNLRILHRSVAQPYFPMIASPRVTPAEIAAIQRAVAAIAPPDSNDIAILKSIDIQGFETSLGEEPLRALLRWLER